MPGSPQRQRPADARSVSPINIQKKRKMSAKRTLLVALVASGVMLAVGITPRLAGAGTAPTSHTAAATWTFQGRVYEGDVGTEPPNSQPLQGVTVSIYGGGNPYPDPGEFIVSTTTNSEGWYGLEAPDGYEFYHIRETDPLHITPEM